MTADYLERRVSRSAALARTMARFAAVLFVVAAAGHRFGLLETPSFFAVLAVVALVALAALLLSAHGFVRLWRHADIGGANIAVAVVLSLAVLSPFAVWGYWAATYPFLTDVATDLDDPPRLDAAARARTAGMNPVAPIGEDDKKAIALSYPTVTGRRYDMPMPRVAEAAARAIANRGWRLAGERPSAAALEESLDPEITLEAAARSLVLGLPADVSVRLTDETDSTYVDMRSASRYGRHDLGENAARITSFLVELDVEVAALAGIAPVEPAEGTDDIPRPEPRPPQE